MKKQLLTIALLTLASAHAGNTIGGDSNTWGPNNQPQTMKLSNRGQKKPVNMALQLSNQQAPQTMELISKAAANVSAALSNEDKGSNPGLKAAMGQLRIAASGLAKAINDKSSNKILEAHLATSSKAMTDTQMYLAHSAPENTSTKRALNGLTKALKKARKTIPLINLGPAHPAHNDNNQLLGKDGGGVQATLVKPGEEIELPYLEMEGKKGTRGEPTGNVYHYTVDGNAKVRGPVRANTDHGTWQAEPHQAYYLRIPSNAKPKAIIKVYRSKGAKAGFGLTQPEFYKKYMINPKWVGGVH